MQTCIPKYIHVRTHTHTHNTHMNAHSDGQTHTHTCIHIVTCTHMCRTLMYTRVNTCTTHAHTNTHAHYCINHFNSKNMRSILVTKSADANYQNTNRSPPKDDTSWQVATER